MFNWFGYRLIADYFENRAAIQLEAELDTDHYNENDFITIKVPTNLPYYTNDSQFERVDGEMQVNGVSYKYVAKRIYNDSIELRCIPYHSKMHIMNARDEFFKLAYDLQHTQGSKKHGSNSSTVKFISAEYTDHRNDWNIAALTTHSTHLLANRSTDLVHCYLPTAEQPPDAA